MVVFTQYSLGANLDPHFLQQGCCSFSSFVYESKEEKYTSRNLCSNNRAIRALYKFPPFSYQPMFASFSSFVYESKEENIITEICPLRAHIIAHTGYGLG